MKYIKEARAHTRRKQGFTLAETLVVVAIIAVLAGLVFLAASGLLAGMRQNKLDTIAQDIYVTAQEHLTQMYTDSRLGDVAYTEGAENMFSLLPDGGDKPRDWDDANTYTGLTSINNRASAAAVLLPEGSLSSEVAGNHYIIEYNAEYGYVYAVYYSEKEFDPDTLTQWYTQKANLYRVFADRKGSGVGYYGGVGVEGGKVAMTDTSLNVSVNVVNAEKLITEITVRVPREYKARTVRLNLQLTGEASGTSWENRVLLDNVRYGYFNRKYTLTLDSLESEAKRFGKEYTSFYPGENVTLTVTAELGKDTVGAFEPDPLLDTALGEAGFNSLFESVDTESKTAYVSSGRHLQNLSAISDRLDIVNVVQTGNIDLEYGTADDRTDDAFWWADSYPGKKFQPIVNPRLRAFTGSCPDPEDETQTLYNLINGLDIETTGNAGLFDTLPDGMQVQDVQLVGARIHGATVGALAGKAEGAVTLTNTGAYLNREDYVNQTYESIPQKLTGTTVGGLIGEAKNVRVTHGYAALVLTGTDVGGLFGKAESLEVADSYADCYITAGNTAAGMAAQCSAASTITGSYTAGFTLGKFTTYAGFTPSKVASIANSYTVLSVPDEEQGSATARFFSTVGAGSPSTNVFYAKQDFGNASYTQVGTGKDFADLRNAKAPQELKAVFGTALSGSTTAYNLTPGLGLTSYPYPTVRTLHHYGDWEDNLFVPGTLVYFEEYADGKYGYFGAGRDYLNRGDKTVVRDGYALLYRRDDVEQYGKMNATVTALGQTVTLTPITNPQFKTVTQIIRKQEVDGQFYFRELPYTLLNHANAAAGYYHKVIVTTPNTADLETGETAYYYFNPHFAYALVQMEDGTSPAPTLAVTGQNQVHIRSPRQLYLLSENFDAYDNSVLTPQVTVSQERDLDYTSYKWTAAGFPNAVTRQKPIGSGEAKPFRAVYNGGMKEIRGVSFLSDSLYTGMFGCSSGRLQNIVLSNEAKQNLTVGFTNPPSTVSAYAYAGALVGYNRGTVSNCAVAGYTMNLQTYDTTLYAGGFVGKNDGRISACSAVTAEMTVHTNRANAALGSFVGRNDGSGVISTTYSLTALRVTRSISGNVLVSGYAGENAGTIQTSYTATGMILSEVESKNVDGFAPTGGSVSNCYFLTDGTYKFNQGVYAYTQTSQTASRAEGIGRLPGSSIHLAGFGTAETSRDYGSTSVGNTYPFAACVKRDGKFVHYGDWLSEDIFGEYGMLYWEHEEHGTNNGYHFYLLDENDKLTSTLCTSHDDGGVITEYGYGYFYLKADGEKRPTFSNVTGVSDTNRNEAAIANLEAQFAGTYSFVLYNTSDAFADTPNGLYPTGSNKDATATFNVGGSRRTYYFSPFFGAALDTDYTRMVQNAGMQIRSIGQLQFLNWNYNAGNTKRLVDGNNYRNFTYLLQTNSTGTGTVNKTTANNKTVADWKWSQSHDIQLSAGVASGFTPIAAAATTTSSSYNAVLYAWFGSIYDGNSYKIEDVNITSDAYTVGLFGVTAGAGMQNIILYSENNAVIQRVTVNTSPAGAYALGGLIGVAYDYADTQYNRSVQNCAIAGYRIIDNSKNQQTLGEANVGGLVGISNGNLTRCTAVVDIEINCTHTDKNGNFTKAPYGNFVRVGGLTGATMGTVDNCYTGGSITVGGETLGENVDTAGKLVGNTYTGTVTVNDNSTSIFIAGIGGSGFGQNYTNISGVTGVRNGAPTFTDCYTYVQFPKLRGTIRTISAIGSVADRYNFDMKATITNCYYLGQYATKDLVSDAPTFRYRNNGQTVKQVLSNDNTFQGMLNGTGVFIHSMVFGGNGKNTATITNLQPTDFAGLSFNGKAPVTTVENGIAINGKYSFPGSVHALDGKNYPFRAVITQKSDVTGETVYVHYGEWPKENVLVSDRATVNLDLLTHHEDENGQTVSDDSTQVLLTLYKDYQETPITDLQLTYSEMGEDGVVHTDLTESRFVSVTRTQVGNQVRLTILGTREGTVTIRASAGGMETQIQVTVTADYSVEAVPVTVTFKDDDGKIADTVTELPQGQTPVNFQGEYLYWRLTAKNSAGEDLPLDTSNWRVEESTMDEDFDLPPLFLNGTQTGEVILGFASNQVTEENDLRTIQATAFNVSGSSGQTVSGTRSRELSFRVKEKPTQVNIYAQPQGTENKSVYKTLYRIAGQNGAAYYEDMLGTVQVQSVPVDTLTPPAGYDVLKGLYLGVTNPETAKEEDYICFADEHGGIVYTTTSEAEAPVLAVYPRWEAASYTATFLLENDNARLDGAYPDNRISFTKLTALTLPGVTLDDSTSDGKQFAGWQVVSDGTDTPWKPNEIYDAGTVFTDTYGNVTFRAVWSSSYTITYYQEGGEATYERETQTYVGQSSSIPLFTPENKDGNAFIGWKLMESAGDATGWQPNTYYRGTISGRDKTGNVRLVACFGQSYTVTYVDGRDGKENVNDSYAQGAMYTIGVAPSDDYPFHSFTGWKVTATSDNSGWEMDKVYQPGETLDNTQAQYSGDVTLAAQWIERDYTVTYDLNGGNAEENKDGDFAPTSYKMNDTVTVAPSAPVKTGYRFKGWQAAVTDAPSGSKWASEQLYALGREIQVGKDYFGNVTFTAQWEPITYHVYYEKLGDAVMPEGTATENNQYVTAFTRDSSFSLARAQRTGYRLLGWRATGTGNASFGSNVISADAVLTGKTGDVHVEPVWEAIPYKRTFQYADGTLIQEITVTVESATDALTLPALPVLNGYTVSGWTKNETAYNPGDVLKEYTDAVFVCTKAPISYTLTYLDLNGDKLSDVTYTVETTLSLPGAPENPPKPKDGAKRFAFLGWKAVSEAVGGWEKDKVYTGTLSAGAYGNVTLQAEYETRTLTLKAVGGEQKLRVKAEGTSFGDAFVDAYAAPTREGYAFTGWYTPGTHIRVTDANGVLLADVSGYTAKDDAGNLRWALTQNQTLIAGWTHAVSYQRLGEVSFPQQVDNSTTLIIGVKGTQSNTANILTYQDGSLTVANYDLSKELTQDTIGKIQWSVTKNQWYSTYYNFSMGSGTNRRYLSVDAQNALTTNATGQNWYLNNTSDKLYYNSNLWTAYYMQINATGAKVVQSSNASTLTFYQVQNATREEAVYDD